MATANELLVAACASGISCLDEISLLRIIAQGASAGGGGGGGGGGTLSTDGTFAANSDALYPSQKAAKTYVDAGDAATLASANSTSDGLYVKKAGDTMTGALLLPNGAVGTPSLSHVADANTGLWFPAADTIAISTAGAERLRVLSTGEVGIGISPATLLDINGVTTFRGHIIAGTDNTYDIGASGANRPRTVYIGTHLVAGGDIFFNGGIKGGSGAFGEIRMPSNGIITLLDLAGTSFGRLQFGGTTSAFPSIKRNGAGLDFRLADDSAYASITTQNITQATAALFSVTSGANQRAGNATLIGGTITVANTTVTANTIVLLTRKSTGGTIGFAVTYTVTAATSFTISSDNVLDTSTYSYLLIEVI